MLENIKISIDDLLLDPNNPRFKRDLSEDEIVEESGLVQAQSKTQARFDVKSTSDDEDATNTSDLYESMTTIGYVPIDRIVVIPVSTNGKYLVIEGNRRISTIKTVRDHLANGEGAFTVRRMREAAEAYKDSFEKIDCMLLDVDGLTEQERAHKISVVLGLRHHGSLLEWEPLPKAFNIYREYMNLAPQTNEFTLKNDKIKAVTSALSIKRTNVLKALKTYIVFKQLADHFPVSDHHYSLIQAGVTNSNLTANFIRTDDETFLLDEPSLERMNKVCQFAYRDKMPIDKKKILDDPKSFGRLGQIYKLIRTSADDGLRQHGENLVARVMEEEDEITVEEALDELTNMQRQRLWAESVNELIDRLESSELTLEDYQGIGNDRANKDELVHRLEPLKRILGL